jgi:hypothetical protein
MKDDLHSQRGAYPRSLTNNDVWSHFQIMAETNLIYQQPSETT